MSDLDKLSVWAVKNGKNLAWDELRLVAIIPLGSASPKSPKGKKSKYHPVKHWVNKLGL